MTGRRVIRVGLTEAHGKALEETQFPPENIEYSFMDAKPQGFRWLRSPIKGFMLDFDSTQVDLIEAVISPLRTKRPWIYSLESMPPAAAFTLLGCSVPRAWRIAYLEYLFAAENCRKLVFWSHAGRETMSTYANVTDASILDKCTVVHPSIRKAPVLVEHQDRPIRLLFSGDFFRKGGVHVIDAFERIQMTHPKTTLRLCCDENIDFNTGDDELRADYLAKIRMNSGIEFGRVTRDVLMSDVLPKTDIYLMPTYADTFGFALLEAMAYGIPVVSSPHFAIPEVVDHGINGFLLDFGDHDTEEFCRGYVVQHIPINFHRDVSEQCYQRIMSLIDSRSLRQQMGAAGVEIARTRFSHERRNVTMKAIYEEALG